MCVLFWCVHSALKFNVTLSEQQRAGGRPDNRRVETNRYYHRALRRDQEEALREEEQQQVNNLVAEMDNTMPDFQENGDTDYEGVGRMLNDSQQVPMEVDRREEGPELDPCLSPTFSPVARPTRGRGRSVSSGRGRVSMRGAPR